MGHVRVKHALAAGLCAVERPLSFAQVAVPPFTRLQRRLAGARLPLIGELNLAPLRWHIARSLGARRKIQHALRSDPPAVVHVTTDQVTMLLGDLQRRVPCVPSLDTLTVDWVRMINAIAQDDAAPAFLRAIEWLERRALRTAPLSIAWTRTVADRVHELAPGAKVEVVHPGIDLDRYAPRTEEREPGPVRVLFVGGRWEAKGGPDLLAALTPDLGCSIELDVVTTEPVRPHAGVRLHTATPGSDTVARLFRRADVFCLPTSVDAVPWVVLEAIASGVPVVSTQIGSIPEIVGSAGILVSPGDVEGLRRALLSLAEDGDLRARMGREGRERAESLYDARRNTVRLIELLAGVAQSAGATV